MKEPNEKHHSINVQMSKATLDYLENYLKGHTGDELVELIRKSLNITTCVYYKFL
jgi:hypothetical protein